MEGRVMAHGFDKLPSWTATVFLFAILTIAPGAAAQFHTAPWTLFGGGSAAVARIDAKGTITTVIPASAMPSNTWVRCGTVDIDDQSIVVGFGQSNGPWNNPSGGLLFLDRWGMIRKTISTGQVVDVIPDDDGSYLAILPLPGPFGSNPLLRVSRAGSITTFHHGFPHCFQAVQVDIDSGDYRLYDGRGLVLGMSRSGDAITTLATHPNNMGFLAMRQHVGDGSLYLCAGFHPPQSSVLRVSRSGAVTTFLGTNFKDVFSLRWDRVSAPRRRLAVSAQLSQSAGGLYFVDEQTRVVTPWAVPQSIWPGALVPPREVASRRIAPGQWEFGLHFAGHAGKAYAMGFSLSGVRPHVALGDGRRIHLAVDALTALSLSGQLAPILTHNVGILGATDRAVVHLDLRALPENVAGFNLYGLAVVLDPAAPFGVAIIADPVRVRL